MGMPITHKNVEAAMEIFKILADKNALLQMLTVFYPM